MICQFVQYPCLLLIPCCKEVHDGRECVCATVCLDQSGSDLITLIGNKLYESSRSGKFSLNGFPAFDPLLASLKAGCTVERERTFKVCAQRGSSLLVLESLAQKWLENPLTSDRAKATIEDHNAEYNVTSDFWVSDQTL